MPVQYQNISHLFFRYLSFHCYKIKTHDLDYWEIYCTVVNDSELMILFLLQCPQLHPVMTLGFLQMAHAVGTVKSQETTCYSSVILVMFYKEPIRSLALRSTTVSSGNLNHPPAQVPTSSTTQIKNNCLLSNCLLVLFKNFSFLLTHQIIALQKG